MFFVVIEVTLNIRSQSSITTSQRRLFLYTTRRNRSLSILSRIFSPTVPFVVWAQTLFAQALNDEHNPLCLFPFAYPDAYISFAPILHVMSKVQRKKRFLRHTAAVSSGQCRTV